MMKRLPKSRSRLARNAAYLLPALGLALLSGCATGGKAMKAPAAERPVLAAQSAPAPAGPSVERFSDGREGFVISEPSSLDAESRRDFQQAVALIKEANYQKGIELLEKVIAAAPGLTAPRIDIAIAYNQINKPQQAEPHLKTALELISGHPVASNEYGLLLRKAGRFAEARSVYERSLAAFPEYHPVERNLAILCDLYLKDMVCALEHYQGYSKAMPNDKQAKMWLADLQARSKQHYVLHTR